MCINFSKFNGIVLWVNFLDLIEYFKDLQKIQCCWSPRNRNVTNLMKYVLNGSFMDTWLDSPYIYDIYDTDDGDSMIVMTQVRSKGWNLTYLTCQS